MSLRLLHFRALSPLPIPILYRVRAAPGFPAELSHHPTRQVGDEARRPQRREPPRLLRLVHRPDVHEEPARPPALHAPRGAQPRFRVDRSRPEPSSGQARTEAKEVAFLEEQPQGQAGRHLLEGCQKPEIERRDQHPLLGPGIADDPRGGGGHPPVPAPALQLHVDESEGERLEHLGEERDRSPVNRSALWRPASSARSAPSGASGTRSVPPAVRRVSSSWITTTSPVPQHQASSSTPSAPCSIARRKAQSVFSGASALAPRWPKTLGRPGG